MLKEQSLISIITVVYNDVISLEATIESVINQSYDKIEYIIIDGGSNDGSVEVIKKYDEQIAYWISEPDNGVYDAMNKALKIITGDWVYFLGSGDILNNVLAEVEPNLKDPYTIYYGNVYRKDLNRIYDGRFSPFKFAVVNISHQAIFYPSKAFRKYQYNLHYRMQADHALNMNLYGDKQYSFKFINKIICLYQGDGFSARNPDIPFFKDKMALIKLNFSFTVYAYALMRRYLSRLIKGKIYSEN